MLINNNLHHNTTGLLNQLQAAVGKGETISIDRIWDHLGRRSFGSTILTIGDFLSVLGPSDIPTVLAC